jgi:hypothetical protein
MTRLGLSYILGSIANKEENVTDHMHQYIYIYTFNTLAQSQLHLQR